MAFKSTSAPARRKSKSASRPKVFYITPIATRREDFGRLWDFRRTLTPQEIDIINPFLSDLTNVRETLLNLRKLLGKPMEQCKVIPFPLGGKRGAKFAKEA